jgi:hypothetical protein
MVAKKTTGIDQEKMINACEITRVCVCVWVCEWQAVHDQSRKVRAKGLKRQLSLSKWWSLFWQADREFIMCLVI